MSDKLTKNKLLEELDVMAVYMCMDDSPAYKQIQNMITLCYTCWVSGNFQEAVNEAQQKPTVTREKIEKFVARLPVDDTAFLRRLDWVGVLKELGVEVVDE